MAKRVPHSVSDYIQQANHNLEFARYIRGNKCDCLDWSATCLFYAAVHYINAYFRQSHIPIPRRHSSPDPSQPGRANIIQTDPALSVIWDSYRNLDDESRDARYELYKITETRFDKYLMGEFEKVQKFVLSKVMV